VCTHAIYEPDVGWVEPAAVNSRYSGRAVIAVTQLAHRGCIRCQLPARLLTKSGAADGSGMEAVAAGDTAYAVPPAQIDPGFSPERPVLLGRIGKSKDGIR
jgi:hypothetical protein